MFYSQTKLTFINFFIYLIERKAGSQGGREEGGREKER